MARTLQKWVVGDNAYLDELGAKPNNHKRQQRRQTSLGILYQSRNREMRIGALKGVKGDPAVDITSKGLFEESDYPYKITRSQVDMCDPIEANR